MSSLRTRRFQEGEVIEVSQWVATSADRVFEVLADG
jgi:hypothetical protein